MVSDGQRAGAETRHHGDDHAGKGAEGKPLDQARSFDMIHPGSPGNGKLADGAPAHRNRAHEFADHAFYFPDAEKGGPVIDGPGKDALHPAADAGEGIAVQDADKHAVLGHTKGLGQCFLRVVHEFQAGKQTGMVERIIVKGEIFSEPAVQGDAIAQCCRQDVQHVGGRVDSRHIEAFFQQRYG